MSNTVRFTTRNFCSSSSKKRNNQKAMQVTRGYTRRRSQVEKSMRKRPRILTGTCSYTHNTQTRELRRRSDAARKRNRQRGRVGGARSGSAQKSLNKHTRLYCNTEPSALCRARRVVPFLVARAKLHLYLYATSAAAATNRKRSREDPLSAALPPRVCVYVRMGDALEQKRSSVANFRGSTFPTKEL